MAMIFNHSHRNVLFYVVARVGPSNSYRYLAVVEYTTCDGDDLIGACTETMNLLSAAENRVAIDAETHLATKFYEDDYQNLKRSANPENIKLRYRAVPIPNFFEIDTGNEITMFPIISSCLLLGVAHEPRYCSEDRAYGQIFRFDYRIITNNYGTVIFDITDLQDIHYGIVIFESIKHPAMANRYLDELYEFLGVVENNRLGSDQREYRPYELLSTSEYLRKIRYTSRCQHLADELENRPLVPMESFDFLRPFNWTPQVTVDHGTRVISLVELSIMALIDSTVDGADFDMSIFDPIRQLPRFQNVLLRCLKKSPGRLGSGIAAGQLLRLAYAGHIDLKWTHFTQLSFEAIASAIESPELSEARSLSVCIDNLRGRCRSLLHALSKVDGLCQVCFLQKPERTTDDKSARLFACICDDVDYSYLLRSKSIIFTHDFSTSLQHPCRFSPERGHFLESAGHDGRLFCEGGLRNPWTQANLRASYSHLVDAILNPGRFTQGLYFFDYSRGYRRFVFTFPSLPSSMPQGITANAKRNSHFRISNIVRPHFSVARALEPGSWTLLVFRHQYLSALTGPYLSYAFVRARRRIGPDHPRREDLEVTNLMGFFRATAPHVDVALIESQLRTSTTFWVDERGRPRDAKFFCEMDESKIFPILDTRLKMDEVITFEPLID